jgi:hypothetical protein
VSSKPGQLQAHPDGTSFGGRGRCLEMLRDHSRVANRRLVDIASAVVDSHLLLPKGRAPSLTGRYRRTCTSLAGSPVLSRDPQSGLRRHARSSNEAQEPTTRHEAEARRSATQARSSKARRLTPVKRAAEAERDYAASGHDRPPDRAARPTSRRGELPPPTPRPLSSAALRRPRDEPGSARGVPARLRHRRRTAPASKRQCLAGPPSRPALRARQRRWADTSSAAPTGS